MLNDFRFFSCNKRADWQRSSAYNLQVTDEGIRIEQALKYGFRLVIHTRDIEGMPEIMDLAVGGNGRVYVLDDRANVWVHDFENNITELLFRTGHGLFTKRALVIHNGNHLIFADPFAESALAAYATSNGQALWSLSEYEGNPLYPLAAVCDSRLHLYVVAPLDTENGPDGEPVVAAGGRIAIIRLNSSGQVVSRIELDAWRLKESSRLLYLQGRFLIAVNEQDRLIYLFDASGQSIFVLEEDGTLRNRFSLWGDIRVSSLVADAEGNMYFSDSRSIGMEGEDNRFILKYGPTGEFVEKISGYRGRADRLKLAAAGHMIVLNGEEASLTLLELKPRTRVMEQTGVQEGVLLFTSFDSTEPETVWHKIECRSEIAEETQMRVSFFASDRKERMIRGRPRDIDDWLADPKVTLREKLQELESAWSPPIINPKDALLFGARGRYIWLKIELIGSEHKTPWLQSLRLYYPRMSYLSYLPSIYAEDPKSGDFLERFLSLFGTFYQQMDEQIGGISQYFDAQHGNGEYLRWLSEWLGINAQDTWSEEQLRDYMELAPKLYELRGTRQGMERMIEIFTGHKPIIIEYFQIKQLRSNSELKDFVTRLYGDNPYSFCVLVKPESVASEKQRLIVQKIIDEEKPAFTEGKLVVLEPWIYMGAHSYLGINTFLSEPTLLVLDDKSSVPFNTVLIDIDRDNRLGIHTRLGLDSELE